MLIRNNEGIGQYVVKKDGNHQRQLTYENVNDGNKLLELAELLSSRERPLASYRQEERTASTEHQLPTVYAGKTVLILIKKRKATP
jgi:hypothetical protein